MPVSCINMNISRSGVVGTGPKGEGGKSGLVSSSDSEQGAETLKLGLLEICLTVDVPAP